MATIAEIYNWFMTSKKPTQAQFWASWGSFWHKLEQIPQSAIAGLISVLNSKADKTQFDSHKTDVNAHTELFDKKVDKAIGERLINADEITKLAYIDKTKDIDKQVSTAQASADALVLSDSKEYTNNLITQLKGGTPLDADTLKKINDKVIALQSIVGGTTPDGDTVVNTLTELMAVLTNYPEGTDLFTLVSGKVAKTDIYNALDCVVAGKVADARQLKVLNDLITALTTSVNNKVDKAAGERLINAAEITKLSGLSNVVTTVKTITSASLTTQDVAGFVTYINALGVVLVVAANEIVEYQLSDTGRVFKLLLRGRSFGTGQPAITATDVEEISLWMQKDLKLSNYPSTRNDGQIPTNRILSTDVSGNLKLYTIATAPAPYMEVLIPDSTLPSTTTNFTIKGAFFTPTMTVSIVGQTINYITFVSDNLVKVNVTTGATEGSYAVTLNNGLSATFPNALLIILGTVYNFTPSDYSAISTSINAINDDLIKNNLGLLSTAQTIKQLDNSRNWQLMFKLKLSPLYGTLNYNQLSYSDYDMLYRLFFLLNGSVTSVMQMHLKPDSTFRIENFGYITNASQAAVGNSTATAIWNVGGEIGIRFIASTRILTIYYNGSIVLTETLNTVPTNNFILQHRSRIIDVYDVKYIELP